MLHAPTSEAKTETTQSKSQLAPQLQRELHPRALAASSTYPFAAATGGAPLRTSQSQSSQSLHGLQSAYGNQAVLRTLHSPQHNARMPALRPSQSMMLQRKCACGGSSQSEGDCAECKAKRREGEAPALIRTKLKMSQPGDQYEQEADRIAEHVMRMPESKVIQTLRLSNSTQNKSTQQLFPQFEGLQRQIGEEEEILSEPLAPEVEEEEEEEEGEVLQSKQYSGQTRTLTSTVPPSVPEALNEPGGVLDQSTRTFMELGFGTDFSQVRIHTGSKAAESAKAINAMAYTVGHQIVFGDGYYTPHTQQGRRLLAHELTHTIQQSNNGLALHRQLLPSTPITDSVANFCKPYTNSDEAWLVHTAMIELFIPTITEVFGSEVGEIWLSYLNRRPGTSLRRRFYSDPSSQIVQGFVNSVNTTERKEQLVQETIRRLPSHCPTLPPNRWTTFNISRFSLAVTSTFRLILTSPLRLPVTSLAGWAVVMPVLTPAMSQAM